MKNNKKKRPILTRWIVLISAVATFATVMTACGKEGSQDTDGFTELETNHTQSSSQQETNNTQNVTQQETNKTPVSPEQAAQDAHTSHVAKKPGHTGGTFLYQADNTVVAITNGAVSGSYKSIDEAKAALFGSKAGDYSATEVSTGLFLLTKTDDPYVHAVPESQGVKNAIARAYQLTDIEWTPVASMPGVDKIDGEFKVITYEAGTTYQGIPYSGTTATDTYVGLNVSLESYLTALKNKNSVLYTENLFSTNNKSATYYGTVCSKFAQYILDIPGSYNTSNVANIPGVMTVALPGKYAANQIKLGDIVLHTKDHTTVCTDILYDVDGNVAFIEISEAVFPRLRRKLWTPEEFFDHFKGYRLCRYQHINDVPAAPEMLSGKETYALMPRFGDKYNYKVSTTKGVVDILEGGYSKAVILRDGAVISEITLTDTTKSFQFDRSVPGKLEMYLQKADGTRSGSVYAYVVKSSVKATDYSNFASGTLTVSFEGSNGTPLYVQVGTAQTNFCSIENAQNNQATVTFSASGLTLSKTKIRVAYQNEFGIYLSDWFYVVAK